MKQYISFLTPCVIFLLLIASCNKDALKRVDDENLSDLYQKELFNISQEGLYYWSGGKKIPLGIDSNTLVILPKIDSTLLRDELTTLLKHDLSIKNTRTGLFVIQSSVPIKDALLNKNGLSSLIYQILPSFKIGNLDAIPTGEIVLKPKEGNSIESIVKKFDGLITLTRKTKYNTFTVKVHTLSSLLTIANKIYESGTVHWCHPDFIVEKELFANDEFYTQQYYLNQANNIDINAPEAWSLFTSNTCPVRVAVIDDGVENHEEFTGRIMSGYSPLSSVGQGAPVAGGQHGQAVAGIIGASRDNTIGIAGIASNTLIIPVNIFLGGETPQDIADAINWSWDEGEADILSNSWGYTATSISNPGFDMVTDAITNARTLGRSGKGSIVVFASGNNHPGGGHPVQFNGVSFPGNVNGVITVGAVDRNGNIWNYSSRGSQMNLVAPSGLTNIGPGDVVTTDREGASGYTSGAYTAAFGGTSAACPQVSGVAALLLSMNPNLTEAQVRTTLQNTATDMGSSGFDNTFGYGRVNAFAALNAIAPSISGANTFCTSSTYTLNNLPTGATVSWTATSGVTLSPSGNNVTVSRTGTTYLNTTLTANITSACGAVVKITKKIESGAINAAEISVYAMPTSTSIGYPVHVVAGYKGQRCEFPEVQWEVSSSSYNMTSGSAICAIDNGSSKNIIFTARGSFSVKARIRNNCGWSGWSLPTFITVN